MSAAAERLGRWQLLALGLVALALLAAVVGLRLAPERTWAALLLGSLYLLFACLAGTLFISIHCLAGAGWWMVLRRVPEAMMAGLPIAAIALALTLFLGRSLLYPWAGAFMFARMALMLTLWGALAYAIRRASLRGDHQQLVRYSAIFAVVFAVTFSIASVDWIMSLEPRWASSIFAVYVFAGLLASGIALVTLIVILLRASGPLRDVASDNHLHDLGKLLFAFSSFWAYIWVSQYLLIWYGNLPEEIPYYVRRTGHDWLFWFLLNPAINWAVPFLVLLPRAAKRNARVLGSVCVLMLAGHYLDLYLLLAPDILPAPAIGPLELLVPIGYISLFAIITRRALETA